jgi:hypothetical protein
MTPPADSTSLLVPVHLDAWVVDESNQELVAWYLPEYRNLEQFESPMPGPFDVSPGKPEVGQHLHWALPDALTHGTASVLGAPSFPLVPNRWLVTRFGQVAGARTVKLWVVESDRLSPEDFSGGSPFLDPFAVTAMGAEPGRTTTFDLQNRQLGASYTIDAWEGLADGSGRLHLTAVGPGNVSFAAHVPAVRDVFAFVDVDAPTAGSGVRTYTYMVVGWYSEPERADPLRGIQTWDPAQWPDEAAWSALTPAARFSETMSRLRWSVAGDPGPEPPTTTLYHGAVVDAAWPYTTLGSAGIDPAAVRVAVGNTGGDALAALVQAYATAQAGSDPSPDNAWLAAGDTLAALISATTVDALSDYGKPGGAALVEQRVRDSWFGATEGGTRWDVAAATPAGGAEPEQGPAPGADVLASLTELNAEQSRLDETERTLATRRQTLYGMWLRVGRANSFGWGQAPHTKIPWKDVKALLEDDLYPRLAGEVWDLACHVQAMRAGLPDPTDGEAATAWADERWQLTGPDGKPATLSSLGLALKASARPRFRHPTDPVVLVSGAARSRKHGEDGRLTDDGTLRCRLPGSTITGLSGGAGQGKLDLPRLDSYTRIPNIDALAAETYLADPVNAPAIAAATGIDESAVKTAIDQLLAGSPIAGTWRGTPPAAFALRAWDQAWAPLFLEWEISFYPTGSGTGAARTFTLDDWTFDGSDFRWRGTGFDPGYSIPYTGRALLTPQAHVTLKAKLADYLKATPALDTPQLEALIAAVEEWDILSQALSGLGDQLITLLTQETFPPPPAQGDRLPCPRPPGGASTPEPALLIGDGYRNAPMLQGSGLKVNEFQPVRGGFIRFERLQIVDAFGQTLALNDPNSSQGFEPILPGSLTPVDPRRTLPVGAVQLAPRIVESTRLDIELKPSAAGAPVCGWFLPNHIDRAISVYDDTGQLLGEIRVADPPRSWRPRPGSVARLSVPRTPEEIEDPVLRAVVASIAGQPRDVIDSLLTGIDETLWMVDPLGGRKDQFLSVLIGRPLAVVQATVGLARFGEPAFNQLWDYMAEPSPSPPPAYRWRRETGTIGDLAFPVRLGELELREDGLLGYWLPAGGYTRFYAPHLPGRATAGDGYIQPIVVPTSDGSVAYRGGIELRCDGDNITTTLLVDPRGAVHAYTGILPVASAALPPDLVDDLIKRLVVTFSTGPMITEPGAMRIPLPARRQAAWQWIQAVPGGWAEEPLLDADSIARLSGAHTELREGWLGFTGVEEADQS